MYHFRFLYEPEMTGKEKRRGFTYFLYIIIVLMNLCFGQLIFSDVNQLKSMDNKYSLLDSKNTAPINEDQLGKKDATFIVFKTYLKDFAAIPFERMSFQMNQIDIHAKVKEKNHYFEQVKTFESNQKYKVVGLTPLEKVGEGYQYKIKIEVIKDEEEQ